MMHKFLKDLFIKRKLTLIMTGTAFIIVLTGLSVSIIKCAKLLNNVHHNTLSTIRLQDEIHSLLVMLVLFLIGLIILFFLMAAAILSADRDDTFLKSREALPLVLDNVPQRIFWKDINSVYMGCNANYAWDVGVGKPENIIGKTDYELSCTKEEADSFRKYDRQVMDNDSPEYHIIETQLRVDGKQTWVKTNKIPLHDNKGKVVGILGNYEDITESKQVEEALQSSEERYRSLIEATTSVIWTTDESGGFVVPQPSWEKYTGQPWNEHKDYGWTKKIHPDDIEYILKGWKKAIREISFHEDWGRIWSANLKEWRDFEVRAVPIMKPNGSLREWVGFITDITESKKMEKELVKMQKLESVGILAGGIAHDFNNYLQAILSCISLAKTCVNPEDRVYERLSEAEKITLQSKGLSQQLLTFSKGGDPVKNTISVSQLIKDAANLALSGSNVRCEFGISDGLCSVEADKGQLSQVLTNLIINADQAMPEGGIIKVRAENVNIDKDELLSLKKGKYVRITIEDQGIGISDENLQKIFDPYFTTKENGSGLGLATCYSIIKKHDGYIEVESKAGIGTIFHIYLPASRLKPQIKPALSKAERAGPEPVEGKGKVLLMDDESIIRLSVARHLEQLNYEVEMAGDGTEAIALYKKAIESDKPFNAVVMDLTIPGGMGGREATERLLEIDREAKVIVASGYVDDPIMSEFKKHGFKGVLAKPYEIEELDEILSDVIMEKN